MSIELLELATTALEEVLDEVVFLGGATVALWITDPAAPPVRETEEDAIPSDTRILGFAGEWIAKAVPHAVERQLPSGATIRAITPPYLLATKIEAFQDRGNEDFLASRDFEDIIALVDGRQELVEEVRTAESELRAYLGDELPRLMSHPRFLDGLFGAAGPSERNQARAQSVIEPRLHALAGQVDAEKRRP
jgi:hypothetical protein